MPPRVVSLYSADIDPMLGETFEPLVTGAQFRCERIVSRGVVSPPGFWYQQAQQEWVLLARGKAVIEFEGDEAVTLYSGDSMTIPAMCRHRVAKTSSDALWIALHFEGAA
jgi:cupin 2 domain-containing protein